jgi:hypothetical protein
MSHCAILYRSFGVKGLKVTRMNNSKVAKIILNYGTNDGRRHERILRGY